MLLQQEKLFRLLNNPHRIRKFKVQEIRITITLLIKIKCLNLKVSLKMDDRCLFKKCKMISIIIYQEFYQEI